MPSRFSPHLLAVALMAALAVRLTAAEPATTWIRTAKSGAWSDPATWEGKKIPGAGDRVQVRTGHAVTYDVKSSDALRVLHVAGTLRFAGDRTTRLDVCLLKVQPGELCSDNGFDCDDHVEAPDPKVPQPALLVGTPNEPVDAKHSATIRLVYVEGMSKETCPAVVCCGGRMDMHGAPLSHTWVKLGATAKKGDESVTLGEPVTGWKVGDRVIVTGTTPRETGGGRDGDNVYTEERLIKALDGSKVTLDRPLAHEHLGEGEFRGEVANLSRNVVVESADPKGVRGHTMYHRYSAGGLSYAEFRHLGKENVLGKYALHFHLCGDSMRGSSVVGVSVWDSHNRWLTIHGTNYLVVRDCVGYKSVGHGYFFEDGTEVFNVVDRCLAVQSFRGKPLPKQVLPFDQNEGSGFWWANCHNTFTRNVACENDRYGYRYEATPTSRLKLTFDVQQPDGSKKAVDIRTMPFVRFEGNETHNEGLYGFNLGEGVNRVGSDTHHPFIVRDTKIWGTHYAFRPQVPSLLVENLHIWRAAYGVYHPNYDNHVYRNVTISQTSTEPFNRGHDDLSVQYGALTVDGLTFDRINSGGMPLIQISDDNPTGKAESHFRNVKLTNWSGNRQRAVANLGGGPRPNPKTAKGVPIYVHDWFGPGKTALVASTRSPEYKADLARFREVKDLTGNESRAADAGEVAFPKLLDPVDDLPPTTVVTKVESLGAGKWRVRGTTADNGTVKGVTVNGQAARSLADNFSEWEVTLEAGSGKEIKAQAVDAVGNAEKRAHLVKLAKE